MQIGNICPGRFEIKAKALIQREAKALPHLPLMYDEKSYFLVMDPFTLELPIKICRICGTLYAEEHATAPSQGD